MRSAPWHHRNKVPSLPNPMSDFGPEVISIKRGEPEAGTLEPGAPSFRLGFQLDGSQAGPVAAQAPERPSYLLLP